MNCQSAHAIWRRVHDLWEASDSSDIHQLESRFYALKISPGGSIAHFLGDIEEI